MANYSGQAAFVISMTADVDLTAQQYRVVAPASTAGNVASNNSGASPMGLGVLQNDPSAGQPANIVVWGFAKAKGRTNACNLTPGTFVFGASDGFVEPAIAGAAWPIFGRWFGPRLLTAGTSVLGDLLVMPIAACIGASTAGAS